MKKWTRILAALLSLLMMLSLAACGSSVDSVVKNLLGKDADAIRQKDFQSPEEFYRAVEMRRMQEALGLTTGAANLDTFSADKLFLQNDLIVKLDLGVLDKGVQDLLRDSAGMDLSWAKSVGLSMTTGKQDYLNAMNLSVRVNDTDVVQGKVVIDNAGGNIYASVPELSEKAFSVNMNDTLRNLIGYRVDASGLTSAMAGSLPSPTQILGLVEQYYQIALDNLSKISLSEGSVTANGVECPCTVANVTIDGAEMLNVAKAGLTQLMNDEQVKEIAYQIARLGGESVSSIEFSKEYTSDLQEMLDELRETDPSNIPVSARMSVYIDAKGEILGRRIEILNNGERVALISFLTARNGDNLGVELEIGRYSANSYYDMSSETTIRLIGGGKYSASGKLSGDFQLSYSSKSRYGDTRSENAAPIGTIHMDGTLGRDGFVGEMVLTPSEETFQAITEELYGAPEEVTRLIRSLSLAIVNKSSGDKADLSLVLRTNGKDLLSLAFTEAPIKPFEITLPTDAVDLDTWTDSLGIASLNTILNKLAEAGIPNSILNMVGRR